MKLWLFLSLFWAFCLLENAASGRKRKVTWPVLNINERLKRMNKSKNKLLRRLMPLSLIIVTLSASTTKSWAVSPDEVIAACDNALEARKEEVRLCKLGVQIRDDENARLSKENTDLRESKDAFYKNPYLLLLLGFVAGVVVAK